MPWDSSQADERIDSRVQPSSRTRKELQGSLPLAVKTSSFRRGEDKCTTRAQTCRGNAEARVPGAGQHERSEMMRCRTGTHLIRSMNGSRFCEAALHAAIHARDTGLAAHHILHKYQGDTASPWPFPADVVFRQSMIRKSGAQFSERIMLKQKIGRA